MQSCDVAADIQTVVSLKGTGQPPSEQLLPDFYAEHVTLGMNRDRRKQVCRIKSNNVHIQIIPRSLHLSEIHILFPGACQSTAIN